MAKYVLTGVMDVIHICRNGESGDVIINCTELQRARTGPEMTDYFASTTVTRRIKRHNAS